ncbi:MAG: methyltransferase domain-containing protein [Porticoccaceae bacterium]|nr:methyltransferase domain-containing protein [Porticoccaceae bacterium]
MPLTPTSNIGQNLADRFKVEDIASTSVNLRPWLDSDFGRYLQACERQVFEDHFAELPGYRFMRLGLSEDPQTLDCFKHIHRFSLHPSELGGDHAALANYTELPLMSESVDVMLLHHALEFSLSPKAVLAEASRVVMPGGHLLLCLFNPYGPMGMAKFPMQLCSEKPQFRFHNLRLGRLTDWLSLLNFHVERIEHGAYNLPLRYSAKDRSVESPLSEKDSQWEKVCKKARLPMGNFYMIHAVKRVSRGIRNTGRP